MAVRVTVLLCHHAGHAILPAAVNLLKTEVNVAAPDDRLDDIWALSGPVPGIGGQAGPEAALSSDAAVSTPALNMRVIAPVEPLDGQFGAEKKKSVPDALWPVLFGPVATDPALPCYAVLDAGRVPGLPDLLAGSGLKHACLFRDEGGGDLQQAAPWIVEIRDENSFVRNLFTRGAAPWQMWDRRPGIFLRSAASLDDLRRHFRKFVRLYSQQTQSWHFFRFYTPEIARTVVAAFDARQLAGFGAPLRLIACPARGAGFCVMTPSTGTGGA